MIDLHCHSTASDGSYAPSELIKMAEKLNITHDEATVEKIAKAVYDHCKDVDGQAANNLSVYNKDTTTFKVMPILTCGTSNPMGDDMKAFMNGVGQAIDPNYQFSMGGRQ